MQKNRGCNQLARDLEQVEFMQVPRSLNMEVDEVVRPASSEVKDNPLGIRMEVQNFPSIEEFHTFTIQGSTSWMAPIILIEGWPPAIKSSRGKEDKEKSY